MAISFKILCGALAAIGSLLGFSYKEISVIVCIYCVPCICVLCALLDLYHWRNISRIKNCLFFATNLTILWFYYWVITLYWDRYPLSDMDKSFMTCMNDIKNIAHSGNITYEECNIYIYCVIFGAIVLFHLIQLKLKNNANTDSWLRRLIGRCSRKRKES